MSLHFWQFCGTKTLGLSPTPVQLGVQRSHLPESAEHLAPGPHKRSRGCGRGAAQGLPGLEGQQVRQPRARQHLNSSLFFFVTSHCRAIWSRGHSFRRAVDCMMAVRKDWGLKKPASHTVEGMAKSPVQASSSLIRLSRSINQAARPAVEG